MRDRGIEGLIGHGNYSTRNGDTLVGKVDRTSSSEKGVLTRCVGWGEQT